MTAKKLTKESEKLILAAVQDVVAGVQDGLSPTNAVVKVARDGNLSPNFVRLICTGYNRGATNFQRETSESVLDKMAEFPLADADAAIEEIWSTQDKSAATAVSEEYQQDVSPTGIFKAASRQRLLDMPLTKQAHVRADEQNTPARAKMSFDHAYRKVTGIRRQMAVKRSEYTMSQDTLLARLGSLADELKHNPVLAKTAHYAASQLLGAKGQHVMEFVLKRNKVAADLKFDLPGEVELNAAPYRQIKECIAAAQDMVRKKAAYQEFVKRAEAEVEQLMRPFGTESVPQSERSILTSPLDALSKAAFNPLYLVPGQVQKHLAGPSGSTGSAPVPPRLAEITQQLEDPMHEQEMRRIQTQTMLANLLSDDEVLSGYDPEDVLAVYNEMAMMSPRTANQPAFVRAYLRKNLAQGSPETFEARELADVEQSLTDTQSPFKALEYDVLKTAESHSIL